MSASGSAARLVRCPTCSGDSIYDSSNPYRPFCCERCKQQDLGNWASESFRVAGSSEVFEVSLDEEKPQAPGALHRH